MTDAAVVKRSAGAKNGGEQIVGEAGIERDSAFDVGAKSDLALNHDESAGLMLGKQIRGQHDVIVGVAFTGGAAKERQAAAKIGKYVPYF